MVHTDIDYLDYQITSPDALENTFAVSAPLGDNNFNMHPFVIEVVAGTLQFCVGQPIGANTPIHAAGAKLVMTNVNRRTIYYKTGAGGDQFIIGF